MHGSNLRTDTRNYGIDLLRLVSMLYIVILHSLGKGGVVENVIPGTPQHAAVAATRGLVMCAVNIFGMISGYVGYRDEDRAYHYENYLVMWLQVVFYGVLITVFFELADSSLVSLRDLMVMFLPVSHTLYWYFTAYTGLFFLIPLLNAGIRGCSNSSLRVLIFMILLLFSCLGPAADLFYLARGYSFLWLVLLYIIGAAAKKVGICERLSIPFLIGGILLCWGVSAVLGANWFDFRFLSLHISTELLHAYTFPTYVLCSLFHVLAFARLRFPPVAQKVIRFLAPGAFGVYLLNDHRLIMTHVLQDRFLSTCTKAPWQLMGEILIFSATFTTAALMIDWVRRKLFAALRIPSLARRLTFLFIKK